VSVFSGALKLAGIVAVLVVSLVVAERCQDNSATIAALRDSVAVAEREHAKTKQRADSLALAQAEIDSVAARERDSLATEMKKAQEDEQEAQRLARSLARQLRDRLPPDMRADHDALEAAHEDEKIALRGQLAISKRFEHTYLRERNAARLNAVAQTHRAERAEDGWEKSKRLTDEYRKKAQGDIRIFGIGIDFTCGVQAGVYYGTKGGDVGVGLGCTIGK
jgi:FtsZ-binding cell division protein ZapB